MTFRRRLMLFGFGTGLGCLLAWAIFGSRLGNTDWIPEHRVKLRLKSTLVKATPQAQATLGQLGLELSDLRTAMDSSSIKFSQSERSKDSLVYYVYGKVHGMDLWYMAATLRDFRTDSTATLTEVHRRER
jgi:hypothetical protein